MGVELMVIVGMGMAVVIGWQAGRLMSPRPGWMREAAAGCTHAVIGEQDSLLKPQAGGYKGT